MSEDVRNPETGGADESAKGLGSDEADDAHREKPGAEARVKVADVALVTAIKRQRENGG